MAHQRPQAHCTCQQEDAPHQQQISLPGHARPALKVDLAQGCCARLSLVTGVVGRSFTGPAGVARGTRAPKEMMWQQGQESPQCPIPGHEGAQDPSAGTKALFWFGKEPPPPTHSVLGIPAATTSPRPPVTQQCPYRVLHPVNPARKEEKVSVRTH